jgi:hypothetical protein
MLKPRSNLDSVDRVTRQRGREKKASAVLLAVIAPFEGSKIESTNEIRGGSAKTWWETRYPKGGWI